MNYFSNIHIACVTLILFTTVTCNSQKVKDDEYLHLRKNMVQQQIKERGIDSKNILEAFLSVQRHIFVPQEYRQMAYEDKPLPIGYGQTISQPYIVAYMTDILKPDKEMRVLEIGTGSGYQASILSLLCKEVYTIEIIDSLAIHAQETFTRQGYKNIKVKIGDGYNGWEEYAPFNAIIVTCAPTNIPSPLLDQLAEGGKMIIPAGERYNQILYLLEKKNGKILQTETLPVLFVPMMRPDKSQY